MNGNFKIRPHDNAPKSILESYDYYQKLDPSVQSLAKVFVTQAFY